MNAYTGGMANFSSSDHFTPQQTSTDGGEQSKQNASSSNTADRIHLPTGGIRTAFHNNAVKTTGASEPPPEKRQKVDVLPTPLSAMMAQPQQPQASSQQESNRTAVTQDPAPHPQEQPKSHLPSKPTYAKGGITIQKQPQPGNLIQQQPQQSLAPNFLQIVNNPLLHQLQAAFQPNQQSMAIHQQQLQQNITAHKLLAAAPQAMTLPVGVGIRLGGVGGVTPAPSSGLQYKHTTPWSATSSTGDSDAGGDVSDKTLAERRERNREHAKRSRVRKKFMLESLQEQVRGLQQDNKKLRMLVQEHIPDKAVQIIAECCSQSILFADDVGEQRTGDDVRLDRKDFALMQALSNGQQCFVLSDPKLPDNPIIFASPGFYKMTGYSDKEVLGRNCRFLQGQGTDPKSVDMIRKAIAAGSDTTVCLLNYKADGTPFWNQFFIAALRDSDNNIVNFVRSSIAM